MSFFLINLSWLLAIIIILKAIHHLTENVRENLNVSMFMFILCFHRSPIIVSTRIISS